MGTSSTQLAGFLDHTLLRADATASDIERLCIEAVTWGFCAVCVNGVYVSSAARLVVGTSIGVAATIGFPLGAMEPASKAAEARRALDDGATELDVVIRIGALREGDDALVHDDLAAIVDVARPARARVKAILEMSMLSQDEKERGARLCCAAGVDFVKTSTGFGPGGATVPDVRLLRAVVGPAMGVKAAGGIRTMEDVERMLAAGATRIGSSNGVAIVGE